MGLVASLEQGVEANLALVTGMELGLKLGLVWLRADVALYKECLEQKRLLGIVS